MTHSSHFGRIVQTVNCDSLVATDLARLPNVCVALAPDVRVLAMCARERR